MSILTGTNIAAPIVPFTTADTYPTHDALYGKGGYREVATLAERDAIPAARMRVGMLCYVEEDDTTYKLTPTGWEPFCCITPAMIEFLSHCSVSPSGQPLWDGQPWGFAPSADYMQPDYVDNDYVD